MVPDQLKKYIQETRAFGLTDPQIMQELFKVGWKMTDLESLLSPARSETMKITKLGHCCLLIETKGKRILTDPGSYTVEEHSKLTAMDAVLFTHEHSDHFHVDSLKALLKNNPQLQVFANSSVAQILQKEGIAYTLVKDGEEKKIGEITLVGIGTQHAAFHDSLTPSENTGYLINNRLWYPGDAFTDPKRAVEILALPVAGPWMKVSEAIDYALKLKPKMAFPVHDGLKYGASHKFPGDVLPTRGIEFIPMLEGDSREF